MTPPPTPLIRLSSLSKSYAGVRALHNVSLSIPPAEIHALCGENGAGKSTLIKILAGSITPDSGTIQIANTPLPPGNVRLAEAAGIVVIHQESVAFPHLSAIDNIFVGREPRRFAGLLLDRPKMLAQTRSLLARLGESIDPRQPVGNLPLAQRQMIAIARALSHRCRLLIMDEPTASLSNRETAVLFRIIRQLQAEGVSILYVSHRLEEIFQLSDRVTVLRDGQLIATRPTNQLTKEDLIQLMVGRELLQLEESPNPAPQPTPRQPILQVQNLTRTNLFQNISFQLHPGEILALAGLVGAGRTEVAQTIFGAAAPTSGSIKINGHPLPPNSIPAAIHAGLALVPEDRQHLGLILPMSVSENLSLPVLSTLTRLGLIISAQEQKLSRQLIADLHIKTPALHAPAQTLSGGNQQKLVLAKWLATRPKILILDEPTRGVDVAAKAEIYKLIRQLAHAGLALLLISSDLPEILLLAHRILVLRTGQIAGELQRHQATEQNILALAMPAGAAA